MHLTASLKLAREEKEKGLMDMDNGVEIAGGGGV